MAGPVKANVALFSVVCLLGTACLGLAIVFSGCGAMLLTGTAASSTMMEAVNRVDEAREHRKGPIPESEWNNVKLWYRISAAPPTYLPKGFSRSRTRNESTGTWFIDERDGKRLFVPKGGAGGIPETVLMTEARNATQWRKRENYFLNPDAMSGSGPQY